MIVEGFIDSLKVATMSAFLATPVARSAGLVEITVGSVVSVVVPVVKFHVLAAAIALPALSLAPVVIVALYAVLAAKLPTGGVNIATFPVSSSPTVPTTPTAGTADVATVNVVVLIVAGFIASLKLAVILLLSATAVAAVTGTVEVTVGAVVSALLLLPLFPQPARIAVISKADTHIIGFVKLLNLLDRKSVV